MPEGRARRGARPVKALVRFTRRLGQRISSIYYRHIFGRRVPAARLFGKLVVRQAKRNGRRDVPQSREDWDAAYRDGEWDFLLELGEMSRHAVLAAYVHEFRPGARVLDVGCGTGKFFHLLCPFGYARFVGVDLSEAALEPLRSFEDGATRFVCADAESYVPEETFDAIVFNESLYYFQDPLEVVERDCTALAPEGVVLVSTYEGSPRALSILRVLKDRYPLLDEIRVSHRQKSWTCSVFGSPLKGSLTRADVA
jgi:SAM-dependent methyltransferase